MVARSDLADYLDEFLQVKNFSDYCPNGLQIEGRSKIQTIVTGVTASVALIQRAIALKADALFVHHGYFWKNEPLTVVGSKKQRFAMLLQEDLNLFAYHLPLDAHPELGNNAQLARVLNISVDNVSDLLWCGSLATAESGEQVARHLELKLGQTPIYFAGSDQAIKRVAWCTGAAQSYLEKAADLGVDAFISGEVSESTYHLAMERGIHYFAAGHHATERYGIKALGHHLADHFGLTHHFVDIPNPV